MRIISVAALTFLVYASVASAQQNRQHQPEVGDRPASQRLWSLEECISHALANNTGVKQQQLEVRAVRNDLVMSKLNLLPSLTGVASHNLSFGRALDETTYTFIDNETVQSNQFYAGSTLTLFNGLQNYYKIKRGRYETVAAETDLETTRNNVTLSVAMAYLRILLAGELVTITFNQLEITRQQAENTRRLVEAGTITRGHLLDIEAQAAREEMQLVSLQNQQTMALLTLTHLLELESPAGFDIVKPQIEISPVAALPEEAADIYDAASVVRPEIISAETRLEIAGINSMIARGAMMPRLTLSSAFSTGYSDARRRLLGTDPVTGPFYGNYTFADQLSDNINYGVGVNLSVPILNGWQSRTSLKNARIDEEQSQYELESIRKQLYREIQQATADAAAALQRYQAGLRAVEASGESFMYAGQRFNAGLLTTVEYNAAKTGLLNAQSDLLQAKYEYIFKTKVIDFYRGIPITLN